MGAAGSLNVLLITIGSHGDVHPFVGLGKALRARGHRVTLATNGFFEELVRGHGLEFVELGKADDYRKLAKDPLLWHPTKSIFLLLSKVVPQLARPTYQIIRERYLPGETVVAASSLAMGALIAQEKLGVPVATIHLAPSVMRSEFDVPVLPGAPMRPWMPRWMLRALFRFADRAVIDPLVAPLINAFRAELGLPPINSVLGTWWHSPRRVIGMWPEWFGPLQPDWPPQVRLTGFPLFDEKRDAHLPAEVETFLAEGDPPIVFTPGSAMWQGRAFFAESADACWQMDRRGILLTRHREHVPKQLLPGVRHFDYIPFSQVLPRTAALVHHGGIGTTAQALAAGIPQLIMPMSHDQFDNASRVEKLGVGRTISVRKYQAENVANRLHALLGSEEIAGRCRKISQQFSGVDGLGKAADEVQALVNVDEPAIVAETF